MMTVAVCIFSKLGLFVSVDGFWFTVDEKCRSTFGGFWICFGKYRVKESWLILNRCVLSSMRFRWIANTNCVVSVERRRFFFQKRRFGRDTFEEFFDLPTVCSLFVQVFVPIQGTFLFEKSLRGLRIRYKKSHSSLKHCDLDKKTSVTTSTTCSCEL